MALLESIRGNLMECQKKVMKYSWVNNFSPIFVDHHSLPNINFNVQYLIKNKICIPKKVINLYISYTLGPPLKNFSPNFTRPPLKSFLKDFPLINCLFGSERSTKNADLGKYK